MNIEQFKYIVEVAKTKSITAASQNYYVSQSGISRSIASLEKELGIQLFNRTRSGVEPTEEGKQLIGKANEIVTKIQEFEEAAQKLNEDTKGILKISAVPGLFSTILLDSFHYFLKDYRNIKVEIDENTTEAIIEGINQSKINIGLIHVYQGIHKKYESYQDIIFKNLLTTKLYVLVSSSSRLASRKEMTPKDLIDQPIAIYNSMFVQEFYQKLASKYGALKILFASNNTEVIRKTVEEGRAITLSFDLVLKDKYLINNKITPIPFVVKKQQVQIPMGYLVSKKGLSKEVETFLHMIHNLVENENYQYEFS